MNSTEEKLKLEIKRLEERFIDIENDMRAVKYTVKNVPIYRRRDDFNHD